MGAWGAGRRGGAAGVARARTAGGLERHDGGARIGYMCHASGARTRGEMRMLDVIPVDDGGPRYRVALHDRRGGSLNPLAYARGLARAAIIPIIGTALVSPLLFSYVFGPGWERAGWLVTWMAPWCFFQLLASPVSGALHVRQRQRLAMWLQLAGLTLRGGAVTASGLLAVGWISEIYALSGALFYGWYLRVILRVIR